MIENADVMFLKAFQALFYYISCTCRCDIATYTAPEVTNGVKIKAHNTQVNTQRRIDGQWRFLFLRIVAIVYVKSRVSVFTFPLSASICLSVGTYVRRHLPNPSLRTLFHYTSQQDGHISTYFSRFPMKLYTLYSVSVFVAFT
jgi:hypothetical protein